MIADTSEVGHIEQMDANEAGQRGPGQGIGCAGVVLGVNSLLMGLVAISFNRGPYSSAAQELWYRWGSIGFLVAGSILPAIALSALRRSRRAAQICLAWMLVVLAVFLRYAFMSSGGV